MYPHTHTHTLSLSLSLSQPYFPLPPPKKNLILSFTDCCRCSNFSTLSWMRAMQALSGLMVPTLLAGAVYRSPTIYHPRRKVILHLKSLAKTKKQRKEFENKPPYFDFSPLRMRAMHVLLTSTAVINVGTYVPFVLLVRRYHF